MTTGDNGTVTINGGQIKITGTGSQTSGIICGSIKSINLDYQDIKYDFILTSGYWCSASTGNTFIYPIIASGKAFAVMGGEEFTDFERFINSTNYTEFNYATLLKDKKLVPALTVTFDANDGTSAPATQTQNVRYEIDSTLTANTFTRTGYTFKGWNTQADGSGTSYADKANVTLTADTTLYAQWQQQETTPPAATLSSIEVSVTGESTLATTEGTATTSAYTASVTGKYSDGTSKTLSASDYSLEWTLDRDISGISINNGTFSVNDSVSAGEYKLTITAKATQGSITGSGTQSVNLTVSEKQEQQQEQQQETTPPAVTLSTIEVSVTGALTLETTEGTATTSAYTATVTGKYSDGMSKTLTDYSVEWTLDKNISGIQISNNGTLSVNNSVKAGEYKLTITAKATQDSVTGSGTRSVNLTVSEKQQEQQQEQQEEQKQENTPATVTLESVGVSITGSDTLTVTEYETLTATYTVTLTYSPYLKARDSGLNKPAHV